MAMWKHIAIFYEEKYADRKNKERNRLKEDMEVQVRITQRNREYGQTGREYTDTNHLWGSGSHGEKEGHPDSKGK